MVSTRLSGKYFKQKEDVSYYWSLGYADREGVIVGDRFNTVRTDLILNRKSPRS